MGVTNVVNFKCGQMWWTARKRSKCGQVRHTCQILSLTQSRKKEPLLLGPRVNQNQYFILQIKNIYIGVAKDVASDRFEVGWACP